MLNHPIITEDIQEIIASIKPELYRLENKNILITGSAGMLGYYIVATILYANKHIFKKPSHLYLITRNSKNDLFGQRSDITYVPLDIAKQAPKIKDINFIIHAASKSAPKIYTKNMVDTLNTNILGMYNLLSLYTKETESILYFSSAEIYGSVDGDKPVDEGYIGRFDHLNSRSCYVEGKRATETICMNYFLEREVPVNIARIFHTFGPSVNLNDGRALSDFLQCGLDQKNIIIKGDKKLKRSFLYNKDATIMFLKILTSKKSGQVYNIGNDKNIITVEELAKHICSIFNKNSTKKIHVIEKQENISYYKHALKSLIPDINKFKKYFDYEPTTDIKTALERTISFLLD